MSPLCSGIESKARLIIEKKLINCPVGSGPSNLLQHITSYDVITHYIIGEVLSPLILSGSPYFSYIEPGP